MALRRIRDAFWSTWMRAVVTWLVVYPAAACRWHRTAPWERSPLAEGQIESVTVAVGPDFQVDRIRFYSEATGGPRFFLVLTPLSDPHVQSVLILNHGWTDRPEDLMTSLGVDKAYATLRQEGRVASARLVLPDVRFSNSVRQKEAASPFKQYLALVGEEIPGLVARTYDVPFERTRWGIGGFSFGGYVALDVARRYPGRFGSVSVVSSFYDQDWTFWPTEPPPPGNLDTRGRGRHTIVLQGPAPRLMLACGTNDRFIGEMRKLHDRLAELGVAHEWSTAPGGHTWAYWKSVLGPMLAFHLPPERVPVRSSGSRSWLPGA